MPIDFKTRQMRAHKIIASGSDTKPYLLLYPSGSSTNQTGGFQNIEGYGTDAWIFISGSTDSNSKIVLGGRSYVSGGLEARSITGSIYTVDGSTPFLTGASGASISYDNSTGQWTVSASGGGGGTSPGGVNGDVQYNSAGTFGGSSEFSFNPTTNEVEIGQGSGGSLTVFGSGTFDYVTSSYVKVQNLTANRVVYADGDKQLSSDSQFSYNESAGRLSVPELEVSGHITASLLNPTEIVFIGSSNELTGVGEFTFNPVSSRMSVDYVTVSQSLTASQLVSTEITGSNVRVNSLTDTRVVFVGGAGKELVDDVGFTYDESSNRLSVGNIEVNNELTSSSVVATNITGSNIRVPTLTPTRVVFVGSNEELTDDGGMTYDSSGNRLSTGFITVSQSITSSEVLATDITGSNVRVTSLTSGRIVFAGTSQELIDDNGFEYNPSTNLLSVGSVDVNQYVTASGFVADAMTPSSVVFVGSSGELTEDTGFTYNPATDRLSIEKITAAQSVTSSYVSVTNLTSGEIVFPTSTGELSGSSDLAFNPVTSRLSTQLVTVAQSVTASEFLSTNARVSSITTSHVVFSGQNQRLTGDSDLTFNANTSTLSLNGNFQLIGAGYVTGSILPGADDLYDLGSPSYRWANVYTGDLHLRNDRGSWTIIEEEEYLSIRNNKTGKMFKFVLSPVEE